MSTCLRPYQIDWKQRDKKLVRKLLKLEKESYSDLFLPRKTANWYAKQLNEKILLAYKQHELPTCAKFFVRYAESTEEYQTRKILRVVIDKIQKHERVSVYEVKRLSGLSPDSLIKKPASVLLESDIPQIMGNWEQIMAKIS